MDCNRTIDPILRCSWITLAKISNRRPASSIHFGTPDGVSICTVSCGYCGHMSEDDVTYGGWVALACPECDAENYRHQKTAESVKAERAS